MPENCGIALEHHRIGKVLDFFKLQRIGCGFYGKLHIFQRIVHSKDFFNPFSVLWYIHIGEDGVSLRISNIARVAFLAIGQSAEASCPAFNIPSSRLIFSHCSFIFAMVSAGTFSASQARAPTGSVFPSYMTVSCQKSNVISFLVHACPSCPVFFIFLILSC